MKMYRFNFSKNMDILIDGRKLIYLAKELGMGREDLSTILRGKRPCMLSTAKRIVDRCKPGEEINTYFTSTDKNRRGE